MFIKGRINTLGYIHTVENYTAMKKATNTCDNIDESQNCIVS